jgi:hypothetical protein
MKTVIDIVNELEGEWHKSKDQLYACGEGVITNYDNFMLAVAECETNFGRSITYSEWLTTRDEYGQPNGVKSNLISNDFHNLDNKS